ncbi:unnamed protein product [Owenia fusiformis]|uniref:Phosphodiesterase n=2 Tax=Owenia fusiformis TaxID=6347 RepID=A0A8J1UDF8_OWEFU|nr:unnamed protein product [Owenia fusiformis]
MATKVIYFSIGGCEEQAEFRSDDSSDDVRDIFRAAAEAGPNDILKLYNRKGSIINISPKLTENTPDSRYKLEVVAAHCTDANIAAQLGFDIGAIENRLQHLERNILTDSGETPKLVYDMKQKVEHFREKLESVEHLSWLGLFKDISSGTSLQPFWNKKNSAVRRSAEVNKRVFEKFIKMTHVQVTDEVRQYLRKPTFDNWQWDDSEMLILLRQMYIDLGFIAKFNIEISVLEQWLFEIYRGYNQVPFHNFKHCFMVTQMMYGLTWLLDLPTILDDIDVLILITSAICHDLDHPGYNNAYQINARTELAMRYNDISPLENHHCSKAFEILEKNHANIFRNLPLETFKKVREGMIKCVLATDMAKHSDILNSFKAIIPNKDFTNKEHKSLVMMILMKVSDISNEARPMEVAEPWIDCLLQEFFNQLLQILVKVADISNEARPMEVAEPWLDCLLQEFFMQSDVEKLEGLPVAPFMDRDKVTKPSSQIGFIRFVLLPLFAALAEMFPAIEEHLIRPVNWALDYYTKMADAIDGQKMERKESSSGIKNGISSKPIKS